MLKARKANRVLKIPDEKKKTYIALGYTITDMDGNMIHEHVEPSEKLEQAEKEIQDLKEKLEEASKYAENADSLHVLRLILRKISYPRMIPPKCW